MAAEIISFGLCVPRCGGPERIDCFFEVFVHIHLFKDRDRGGSEKDVSEAGER